jgi:hypothetical protein
MSAIKQPLATVIPADLPTLDGLYTPNVVLVLPSGYRVAVNATPEAQAVWLRLVPSVRFEAVER